MNPVIDISQLLISALVGLLAYWIAGLFVPEGKPKLARVPLIVGVIVGLLVYIGVIAVTG